MSRLPRRTPCFGKPNRQRDSLRKCDSAGRSFPVVVPSQADPRRGVPAPLACQTATHRGILPLPDATRYNGMSASPIAGDRKAGTQPEAGTLASHGESQRSGPMGDENSDLVRQRRGRELLRARELKKNSEWDRRTRALATDRGLVGKALADDRAFADLMGRYRGAAVGYLTAILLRQKIAADQQAAAADAAAIWEWLIKSFPDTLAGKWRAGGVSFRVLLRGTVHDACASWSKPAMRKIMTLEPDEEAWRHHVRDTILDKARERLGSFQRENEARGNLYHAIFRLWETHSDKSLDELNERLATLPGGRRVDPAAFRQALGRARDLFGKYLIDEVSAWIAERDAPTPEKLRAAFEEMDLMNDYASKSKHCRFMLELEDDDEE